MSQMMPQSKKDNSMAQIDYYMIPISPFTYLAGTQLEEVAAKHGAKITYKPFALLKLFEAQGTPMVPDRHPSRIAYRAQEIPRIAKMHGMEVNLKPAHWPTNPVPSCSAIIAAQAAGGGDLAGLVHGFCKACWAEERDIAEDAVVTDLLAAHGFDPALALSGMLEGAETYERNTQDAAKAGVFGAPTYIVGDQIFWGQDRISYLDAHLAEL